MTEKMTDKISDKKKLLIVDDDKYVCDAYSQSLQDDFDVITTEDASIAYKISVQNHVDAILLDINLGDQDGIELCRQLRQNPLSQKIPILLMTGFTNREKILASFRGGADDYIEKPIEPEILVERINARIRRIEDIGGRSDSIGNLKVFFDRNEIELNGKVHGLSQIELSLLKIFVMNVNKKVSREDILSIVWKNTVVEQRTVDVHISTLRKKLKDFNHQIDSLYGSGYILRPRSVVGRAL